MIQEKPLNILFILNASSGGATQGIIELLRILPRERFKAYLIIPDKPTPKQEKTFNNLAQDYFKIHLTWWNRKTSLPWFWRFLLSLRDWFTTLGHIRPLFQICKIIRENKIDIVYTNTILILDGALAAKLCGIPHIWHIKEWVGQHGRVKFGIPDRFLVKIIAYFSTYIIVMTNFIGNIFKKYNSGDKLKVIYDGVNTQDFQGDLKGLDLRRELGIPNDKFVIAMAASPSSIWKRHDLFIDMASLIAQRNSDVVFVAFGSLPNKNTNPVYNQPWLYYQRLREKLLILDLIDNFLWVGFCTNIPQMMDSIDVLVHPCENEPFGRVAIEAMAAKRPVIGPNQGGIAESVIHQKTGLLVEPCNPKVFADAVMFFKDYPQKKKEYGMNGYKHVETMFSIEQHTQKITALFDHCKKNSYLE